MYRVMTYRDIQAGGADYIKSRSMYPIYDKKGELHDFTRDIVGSSPFGSKHNDPMKGMTVRITVNGQAYPHMPFQAAPTSVEVGRFLDRVASPRLKAKIDNFYRQKMLYTGIQSVSGLLLDHLFGNGMVTRKVAGDVELRITEGKDGDFIEIKTSNMRIEEMDSVYDEEEEREIMQVVASQEIPGRIFARVRLQEEMAYVDRLAVDNALLYRFMTEKDQITLDPKELAEAKKESRETLALELTFMNAIEELQCLYESIPTETPQNIQDRKVVHTLFKYMHTQQVELIKAARVDPDRARMIIGDVKIRLRTYVNYHSDVFLRYPRGLNTLAHIGIFLTVVGAVVMVSKGFYTLKTTERFDPLLFKPERPAIQEVENAFHNVRVGNKIVKPCTAEAYESERSQKADFEMPSQYAF